MAELSETPPDVQAVIDAVVAQNKSCADCTNTKVTWACLTHGCLICSRCSGIHRSLGTDVSKIRSLKLDIWDMEGAQNLITSAEFNKTFEYHVPEEYPKPRHDSVRSVAETYITAKYKQELFTPKKNKSRRVSCVDTSQEVERPNQGNIEYDGILHIFLKTGHKLPNADLPFGKSDPYVRFTCGPFQKCQSTVKKSTLNPTWNEQLSLTVSKSFPVIIECWDADRFASDDWLGQSQFEVGLLKDNVRTELTLPLNCGKSRGKNAKLCLDFTFISLS